jgi:hypothetical protein
MSKTYTIRPNPHPGAGLAFADAEIHLPSPVRYIVLISGPSPDAALYLHFQPLSKSASASPLVALGGDSWLPMAGTPRNYPSVRFSEPRGVFYLSGDGGSSGLPPDFTLLCTDDVCDLDVELSGATELNVIVHPNPLPVTGPLTLAQLVAAEPLGVSGPLTDAQLAARLPLAVKEDGGGTGSTNQVSIGLTATAIIGANAARRGILLLNQGPTAVFVGYTNAVTLATGVLLDAGSFLSIPTALALWGITTVAQTISYIEVAD